MDKLYKNQSLIYKSLLYVTTILLIVFFFPRGGKFKYEFQKGKPWQYENLYAPFDFPLKKTDAEISAEKGEIANNQIPYYQYNQAVVDTAQKRYHQSFGQYFNAPELGPNTLKRLEEDGAKLLDLLYQNGILPDTDDQAPQGDLYVLKNHEAQRVTAAALPHASAVGSYISKLIKAEGADRYADAYWSLLKGVAKPNLRYDADLSQKELEAELSQISLTRGNVDEGKLIIAKGEVVEAENFKILNSLKEEYKSELWTSNNFYFILFGYTILVALVLMMLLLFLKKYRPEVFRDNTKVTFIFVNILFMVFVTTLVVKYNEAFVFVVPLCILPLILKTFFDARLGLFVHVLTVLILGFVVPNSFEYIFLQTMAGIVTILTVSELYKRANLFISVGQITLIYVVGYFAFHIIHEGNLANVEWLVFGLFLLNGMITLFVQPLIYIYEKLFGLVSDVSLLELSDTNTKLLKELANKAPGTFHHSLQVANLAEAAANEIGANAMLVRVGALYHDIGKMENPTFFTENQITGVNPHDGLPPEESAQIIIDHVIKGIEIARKRKLPDRVIDFIRTHHGDTTVYYFYKLRQQQMDREAVGPEKFRYPGPTPFSKETAILMMCDSVEAASKSLKNPTFQVIDSFIDKIVDSQVQANQFLNANITFKEIESIKKVLKHKLTNIYHLRVEYPE